MAIKYKWLAGHLREQLPDYTANGIHRLPTEAAISQRYKVSRQTVRQATVRSGTGGINRKKAGKRVLYHGTQPRRRPDRPSALQ